ncbi:hypothetical protein TNCV_2632031 [Trichonephila clavipes]|nr:hypothetical protein TNCV_2632031 [Trichonephila clavipes]
MMVVYGNDVPSYKRERHCLEEKTFSNWLLQMVQEMEVLAAAPFRMPPGAMAPSAPSRYATINETGLAESKLFLSSEEQPQNQNKNDIIQEVEQWFSMLSTEF